MTQTKQSTGYHYQYAAKFLCTSNSPGTSQTSGSVYPGSYQTAVNIHNPNYEEVRYRMKIALPGPGQISKFVEGSLGADEVTNVDCGRIVNDFGMPFIHGAEGFLVIQGSHSLDVTAVYTAGHGNQVKSIDVEQIRERKI